MKIIRLENTSFGFSSFLEDEVNKVIEFDSESGVLEVHTLESPQRIPFGRVKIGQIEEFIPRSLSKETVRIIHNLPIKNAYSAPFKIYLDITLACSLKCPFCLSESGEGEKTSLSLDTIDRFATEIKELGVIYVKIGGGDPFLHPDFESIIALLRSAGCFLSISTNSATLTPNIARVLAGAKVRTSISIEGMEVVNDNLRGQGHFKMAINAIKILKENNVDVILRTTLLRQNLDEVPELVNLAKKNGVKIKFSYCRPAGRAVLNQTILNPQESHRYLKVLEFLNSPKVLSYVLLDEGMMLHQPIEVTSKLLRGRMCGAANRSMHIDANGKSSPCVFLGPTFSFGKIYQDGSIGDFWRGNVGNKFQIVREIRQPKECDSCNRFCKNECLANRFYFWGNFEQQDPNCLYEAMRNSGILDG